MADKNTSFALQAFREDLPTLERSLEAMANDIQDCVADGEHDRLAVLRNMSEEMLARFAIEEVVRDPQGGPAKVAMMKSLIADAFQEYELALKHDEESLSLASDLTGKAKALNNVSQGHLRLGHYGEALRYAEECLALASHTGWAPANWMAADVKVNGIKHAVESVQDIVLALAPDAKKTFLAHFDLDGDLKSIRSDYLVRQLLEELT